MSKTLVSGGSGSLGRHLIRELIKRGERDVVSISRDEGLIKDATEFVNSPFVTWIVGDTKDPLIGNILKDTDVVYHAAALKDVVFAEKYPREAVKNNIYGILNLLDHSANVKRFINISSDKAIGVVNCYGATKLLAEYLVKETNGLLDGQFVNVRCPNLLGSRGSVIEVWKRQAEERCEILVTDPEMTRFFISIPDAASYIADLGIEDNPSGEDIYYPLEHTKKFRLGDLAEAFASLPGSKVSIKTSGKRVGEKVHESYIKDVPLATVEELRNILKDL